MTWTKIDDQFHAHPKVVQAWLAHPRAIGLHVLALSHCAAYLTDGHVSEVWVRTQVSGTVPRCRVTAALVDAGLWEPVDDGWKIHDYLEFNEARAHVLQRRAERGEAGRKGAAKRWGKLCSPYGEQMAPARPTPDLFPQLASS